METLKHVDREALRRSLRMMRERDPRYHDIDDAQLDQADDEWLWSYGSQAAFNLQLDNLRLKAWQPPPMHAELDDDDDDLGPKGGRKAAAILLQRLLAAKLSRFEPDPIAALERVEQTAAAGGVRKTPPEKIPG